MIKYLLELIVDKKDFKYMDMYVYGCEILIFNIMSILVLIIIGIYFNSLLFSIIFLLYFCPLRVFLGGYHCKNKFLCMFMFFLISIVIINLYNYLNLSMIGIIFVTIILLLMNFQTPYSQDKLLNNYQNILYAKKIVHYLTLFYFISVIYYYENMYVLSAYVYACLTNAILFIIGKIKI
ncbi:accessory gene regulator B family protein [Thomasclavelia sp.]|uniref:accessory gene regulator B family protein n=1 Tax=Thomasclavelia sp. TaxID=3025757 RepID=UPI00345CFDDE